MNETGAESGKEGANESQSASHENENREHRRGGQQQHRRGSNRRGGQQQQHQQQSRSHQADASLNMSELRELAELVSQHGFTDFEFENENIRVRLRKELAPQFVQAAAPQTVSYSAPQTAPAAATNQSAPQPPAKSEETVKAEAAASEEESLHKITSPIVGTFYRAPSPEADNFVKVGSQVTSDTVVCIIEAMKLMNEIPAEIAGEIVKIYVENGQPVEYGQPLFGVKK